MVWGFIGGLYGPDLRAKYAVRPVGRLMSDAGIDVWDGFARWVPSQVGAQRNILVAMDWTTSTATASRRWR